MNSCLATVDGLKDDSYPPRQRISQLAHQGRIGAENVSLRRCVVTAEDLLLLFVMVLCLHRAGIPLHYNVLLDTLDSHANRDLSKYPPSNLSIIYIRPQPASGYILGPASG